MNLFDNVITDISAELSRTARRELAVDQNNRWESLAKSEIIFANDTAFELGGGNCASAEITLCTDNPDLVKGDSITLIGKDLNEISSDCNYARVTLVKLKKVDTDDDETYRLLKQIQFTKYNVLFRGFMSRASSILHKEQVRISKKALKDGMDFAKIGNGYIDAFKSNPSIQNVQMFFITSDSGIYGKIAEKSETAEQILQTLNHILGGLQLDCNHCEMKPICDEVDSLREMHLKSIKNPH